MLHSDPLQALEWQPAHPDRRTVVPSLHIAAPARQEAGTGQEAFAACAQHPGLLFFHAGTFHAELAQAATQRVRQRLGELDAPQHAKDRLCRVFIELIRHLGRRRPDAAEPQGRIAVGCLGEHFWVLSSWHLPPEQVTRLRPRLEAVRRQSADELASPTPAGHRLDGMTELSPLAEASSSPADVDPDWLQVARNSSTPIEYGFSGPLPDGRSQLHVRAWI